MKSQKQCYRERVRTLDKILRDFDKLIKHLNEYEEQASYAVGFMDCFIERLNKEKSFFVENREELLSELNR